MLRIKQLRDCFRYAVQGLDEVEPDRLKAKVQRIKDGRNNPPGAILHHRTHELLDKIRGDTVPQGAASDSRALFKHWTPSQMEQARASPQGFRYTLMIR